MVLVVLPMVELVEVAEGVLKPSDHLGTHPDRFLFKIVQETCFKCAFLAKDSLLVLHLEVRLTLRASRRGTWSRDNDLKNIFAVIFCIWLGTQKFH